MSARTSLVFSLVVAIALLVGTYAGGQTEVGESMTLTGTVESIDLAKRIVVLKGADGKTASFVVPASIQNLDKVKAGDTVTTTYVSSIAAEILKPGEERGPAAVSSAKQGGGEVLSTNQVSEVVKVDSIDLAANSITLTGPRGNTRTVKVKRPDLQAKLKELKPGDEIQITYTEAMAISVEPKK
jgi:hypothetical protein